MSTVIPMILTNVGTFICGMLFATARARRRRTRDILMGFGAGRNVAGHRGPSDVDGAA
jgi:hypothetical protein